MKSVAIHSFGTLQYRRLATAGILFSALLTAVHPVASDGIWWELSKGRAFASGSWNPTADLIAGVTSPDAHWLSGLLPYLLFTTFGVSGLMWLKVGGMLVLARPLLARASQAEAAHSWELLGTIITAALLAAHQAFEPGLVLQDTVGLVAIYLTAEKLATRWTSGRVGLALLLLCLWSNLGPRCIVGVVIALHGMWPKRPTLIAYLGVVVLMLGVCCLTPAGRLTLRDSAVVTFPQIAESTAILEAAGWSPWWSRPASTAAIAFIVLNVAYLWHSRQCLTGHCLLVFLAAHVLAGASSENLPLAALWMALAATSSVGVAVDLGARSNRIPSVLKADAPWKSPAAALAGPSGLQRMDWRRLGFGAVLLVAGFSATRPWTGCGIGLGWGFDPRLNPEAFAASIADVALTDNAHCVGLREAGLLCWHVRNGVRPFDTPATALLNQRLKEHVLLTSDLSARWQIPHRRPDGSWGGWWQVLKQRGTTALVVPSENLELISALEPTVWKPLSLNAVSLVYGKAGDPNCSRQIVQNLSLRQFVDRGAWTYQPASESSADTIGFLTWLDDTRTRYQSLRLARVFRAMQMHFGALKILHALSRGNHISAGDEAVRGEFAANQLALGYLERVQCGRSSELRLRASFLTQHQSRNQIRKILNWSNKEYWPADDPYSQAVQLYVAGDLTTARSKMSDDRPETLYARALLLLESGEPGQARTHLNELLVKFSNHRLSASARQLLATLVD